MQTTVHSPRNFGKAFVPRRFMMLLKGPLRGLSAPVSSSRESLSPELISL